MNQELRQYLQQRNFLPNQTIHLDPLSRIEQFKSAKIAPEWDSVSDIIDELVQKEDQVALLYLHTRGEGYALKAFTADYYFHRILEHNDEDRPLHLFQQIVSPDFIQTLHPSDHEKFADLLIGPSFGLNDEDLETDDTTPLIAGLRSYVNDFSLTVGEEEEIEQWLIDQLQLKPETKERIKAERDFWHITLEKVVENIIEEPDSPEYNFEAFQFFYAEDPKQALFYFKKLPVQYQEQYIRTIMSSLIEDQKGGEAHELLHQFSENLQQSTELTGYDRTYATQILLTLSIECADSEEFLYSLKLLNPQGVERLCTVLDLSEEQLTNVFFFRYSEKDDPFTTKLTSPQFIDYLNQITRSKKPESLYFSKRLQETTLFLYPEVFKDIQDKRIIEDKEMCMYFAIHFGVYNDQKRFAYWLRNVQKVCGPESVGFVYKQMQNLTIDLMDREIDDENDNW